MQLQTPLLAIGNKYPNQTQLQRNPDKLWTFRYAERACGARTLGCGCVFKCTWWGEAAAPEQMRFHVLKASEDSWHTHHM